MEAQGCNKLYLVSPTACVAAAGPEFGETLKLFLVPGDRTSTAFSELGKLLGESSKSTCSRNALFNQRIFIIIKELDGLTQLSTIMKYNEKLKNVPLKLLAELLEPYAAAAGAKIEGLNDFIKDNRKVNLLTPPV